MEQHAVALLWSLWTELGVPGVRRDHATVIVDAEPLIVVSPLIMQHDARLRDEVYRWCAAHADRISTSRLQGLVRAASPPVRAAFGGLAATLAGGSAVRWPTTSNDAPWTRVPEHRPPHLQSMRPSLARLRLRAMAGVGARADVLAELLGRIELWTIASDLTYLGYSKRNVARVLAELAEAGLASQRAERNTLAFQLVRADSWRTLAQLPESPWPRWDRVFGLVVDALTLADLASKDAAVRRVESAKIRDRMRTSANLLGLAPPPDVRGVAEAWVELTNWCASMLSDLAMGGSCVFTGRGITPVPFEPGNREAKPIMG